MRLKPLFLVVLNWVSVHSYAEGQERHYGVTVEIRSGDLLQAFGPALMGKDLLVIGEAPHYTDELPSALVSAILPDLQTIGYRAYLSEYCHAYGWLADLYVLGELDRSDLPKSVLFLKQTTLDGLRALNERLQTDNQIHFGMIDVNHFPWAFRESVSLLRQFVDLNGLLDVALQKQFGGAEPCIECGIPDSYEGQQISQYIAGKQSELWGMERSHISTYTEELNRVTTELRRHEAMLRETWGDSWYEIVLDLVTVENASAVYRRNQERQLRADSMLANVTNALLKTESPTVLVVGAHHAQRTPPSALNPPEITLGFALADRFCTSHVMAYGLSGSMIRHFSATTIQQFDNRQRYSPDAVVSVLSFLASEPSIVLLDAAYAGQSHQFERVNVIPGQGWDAYLVFPQVSVLQSLR